MAARPSTVTRWLTRAPAPVFSAYAIAAAFSTYFCMYAYRRPFAVGTYEAEPSLFGLDAKTAFLIAQVIGYAGSKLVGIKIISELDPRARAAALLATIGVAQIALVLFGALPGALAALAMVLNGLALGLVWGLVFGFLEGRTTSDLLGAGLCASFIVASGATKAVGRMLLEMGVPERWMPATTGLAFAPLLLASVILLSRLPPPSRSDEALRTARAPMDGRARRAFFRAYAPGLCLLIAGYVLFTVGRDVRDLFARELWDALGYAKEPAILAKAELPVAAGALSGVALLVFVRDNRRALAGVHALIVAGALLTAGATLLVRAGAISPTAWMIAVGLGLYVSYVPYNCVLFDRLIAASGSAATAGFLIYVADGFGYLGSVAALIGKSVGLGPSEPVAFLESLTLWVGGGGAVLVALGAVDLLRRVRR